MMLITSDLLYEILNSTLSPETKRELIEWLWGNNVITDEQYQYIIDGVFY